MTCLIQTPGITVKQHEKAFFQDNLSFLLGERIFAPLYRLTEQRLSNVRPVAGGDSRGGICRAQEVDVSQESGAREKFVNRELRKLGYGLLFAVLVPTNE